MSHYPPNNFHIYNGFHYMQILSILYVSISIRKGFFYIFVDILPPSMTGCSDDRSHLTKQIRHRVKWDQPEFYDEFGNDVTVSSNMETNEADLPWGDNTIKYTGRKENNALTTTCDFTESVDRMYTKINLVIID